MRTSFILITLDKISLLFCFFFLFEHFATRTKKYKINYSLLLFIQVFHLSLSFSLRFLFGLIIVFPVFVLPRVLAVMRLLFLYTFLSSSFSPLLNIFINTRTHPCTLIHIYYFELSRDAIAVCKTAIAPLKILRDISSTSMFMREYIYIYIYVYLIIYIYIYTICIRMCTSMYICMYACTFL